MRFANPEFLLLLIVLAAFAFWQRRKPYFSTVTFSDISTVKTLANPWLRWIRNAFFVLRYGCLILIIITLARPQGVSFERNVVTEGVDILLALDVSGSMRAEDFKPENRLSVAKKTIEAFVQKRQSDRIGLVVFGADAYTVCPLTLDYGILLNFLTSIKIDMAGDGTAIGMAIATALNRLKTSESKSKIIVLLTDGENNMGEIDPVSAADLAKKMGVKVYTIGVGKQGGAPIPIEDPVYGKVYARAPDGQLILTLLDEATLQAIAQRTNGQYFRATDEKALADIYEIIDRLEKTKIKTKQFFVFTEHFYVLLWVIFCLIVLEWIVYKLVFVMVP
ncbi:VWA domain-containing protein [Thermoproteota archaeon]